MDRHHLTLNHHALYALSGDDIMSQYQINHHDQQRGAAAVEFAIIAMLFFTLLFGIIEFGRMFYMINTVQEVTRRVAREAVIRWIDSANQSTAKNLALFGGVSFPGGGEITANNIDIRYLDASGVEILSSQLPTSAPNNIAACLGGASYGTCIAYVQVSIVGVSGASCPSPNTAKVCYIPMIGLFPFLSVPIPASTVTMPAESMGYTGN